MELAIIADVHRKNGQLRFAIGDVIDFPKSTWQGIANSLGRALETFAKPPGTLAAHQRQTVPGDAAAKAPGSRRSRGGRPRKTGV